MKLSALVSFKLSALASFAALLASGAAFAPTHHFLGQGSARSTMTTTIFGAKNGEWDDNARRSVLSSAAAITAASTAIPGSQAFLGDPPTLYEQVRALETANKIGQPFKKIYEPNSSGDPAKHLPQVTVSEDKVVTVKVNHVMKPEHFIQFLWLKDTKTNEVVVVKNLPSTDPTPPSLQVKCPPGAVLRPYLFCNLHGLWKGDEFTV